MSIQIDKTNKNIIKSITLDPPFNLTKRDND